MTGPEIEFVGGADGEPPDDADELGDPRRARRVVVGAAAALVALLVVGLIARAVRPDPHRPDAAAPPAPLVTTSATTGQSTGATPGLQAVGGPTVVGEDGVSCLHRRADGALLVGVRLANLATTTVEVHGVHVPRGLDRVLRVGVGFPCGLPRQLLRVGRDAVLTVRPHDEFWVGAVVRPRDPCAPIDALAFVVLLRVGGRSVTNPVAAEVDGDSASLPSSCVHLPPSR